MPIDGFSGGQIFGDGWADYHCDDHESYCSCPITSNNCKWLYNVNYIVVNPTIRVKYLRFIDFLDKYLLKKYGKYYEGLQLYEGTAPNSFYVIARYNNIRGVYRKAIIIGDFISNLYTRIFGTDVTRTNVVSFTVNRRLYC